MPKRLTQKDFESRARLIHNGKYDYSKVMYSNSYTDVCIICPIHGEFWQEPHSHLRGCGCSKCSKDRLKKPICGVGINDCDINDKSYEVWHGMITRCYSEKLDGSIKYKPFQFWRYRLADCTSDLANQHLWNDYYLKHNVFKRDNAPKVGDRVKLRYRKTKKGHEVFDLNKAKIVEIIRE